ncbi:MAG: F0F1 ATP synthase subunit alpha [Candidatus Staskawiczbacteria bacterium RIFOXYB1_FULL_37_44]|uniref:ATP synthase subunit alpha n=1 Tax=Candidatus Staskawiczbacteria bacterium RIFOXYB1_FULL_37_44 TaxID=1802223 RepID=A0A1G2IV19_9BACT|nr:MAG: F0F1 ATP synthase subunit alpha [Candidatus Staskawiczbacteria bacterium RIFOXYB1_FULL_37_44]OGZ84584.1 MAG: F0F1 ATP synthase subunit alpha [Candidatus Staskawiczbacteria bacterium RIFOXYC1_FULL_37_52]OGZ87630.1 MAG: F0F1 ATP synthase subunit alpha [Candidatus Staskawiczbacteria bacterium RIFOXYC2_FULL_37_19]OGZ89830.1 MAG: F0F1 ATP synthase subunit alpha [Candidatus Staskawiczbacteria bacterium RIFOXYD1_FULL_37_110]
MSQEIIEKIKQAIEGFKDDTQWEEIGKVIEVGDGILKISGLKNAQSQEVLVVEISGEPASASRDARASARQVRAVALNLEEDSVGALVLGDANLIKSGDTVKRTKQLLSIAVGEQLLGRVVDPLGNPIDGKGPIFSEKDKPQFNFLENDAPNVIGRESVNQPLHTGIKAIDSMIPIGRGQRELIIGDRQTGKTAVVLDTIINQQKDSKNPPICIYVAIGQKESKVAKIVETLKNAGAMEYTIVVSASASSPAAFWYLAPFAGCAIGEYFRDKGKDAVVIYDDLSKHAWAYRQISLLLRRPPGREAYPGDVFYLHSRLLERAAKLSKEKGGGSLTALPIIETQLGDVTAYIPTNVISITDGQIYLESDLFYQGTRPAVNVGLSVSRVGSSAQTKAMKKVAGKLRLELAQFRELQTFVQFASDVDEVTKQRINKGRIITEILKQSDLAPISFEKQVLVLYAALNDHFNKFEPSQMQEIEKKYLEYFQNLYADLVEKIKSEKAITDETEVEIKEVISKFVESIK